MRKENAIILVDFLIEKGISKLSFTTGFPNNILVEAILRGFEISNISKQYDDYYPRIGEAQQALYSWIYVYHPCGETYLDYELFSLGYLSPPLGNGDIPTYHQSFT